MAKGEGPGGGGGLIGEAEETVTLTRSQYLMATRRYSMWWPKGKSDLLLDYPQLRKVKAFLALENNMDMLFVWFYACRISPIVEHIKDDKKRIELAIKEVWGKNPPKHVREKYPNRQWSEDVAKAIASMRSFLPDARIRMRLIFSSNLDRIQKMLEEDSEPVITWKQKREFFEAVKAGNELLHDLLPMVEEGAMGVVEVEGDEEYADGEVMAILTREARTSHDEE